MISDGFGDHDQQALGEQAEEIIRSPWVDRLAAALLKWDLAEREDLAQEGRIAMWQAASTWDGRGTLEGFLHQKARWRMLSLLNGSHRPVGQEGKKPTTQARGDETRRVIQETIEDLRVLMGKEPSAEEIALKAGLHPQSVRRILRTPRTAPVDVKVTSLEELIEAYGTEVIFRLIDHYEAAMLAYHYGQIHDAVSGLRDGLRTYVFLRFWCGVAERTAVREAGVRGSALKDVQEVLREQLAHLEGVI